MRELAKRLSVLQEAVSMGAKDKKTIEAFTDKKAAESKKFSTDGKRLDGLWMGGKGIAVWEGGKIHFNDLGSKAAEQVQRYIKKSTPKNWLAEGHAGDEVSGGLDEGYRIKTSRVKSGSFDEFGVGIDPKVLADDLIAVADELYSSRGKMRKLQEFVAGLVKGKAFGDNFLSGQDKASSQAERAKDSMYKADFEIGQAAGSMEALARDIKKIKRG